MYRGGGGEVKATKPSTISPQYSYLYGFSFIVRLVKNVEHNDPKQSLDPAD